MKVKIFAKDASEKGTATLPEQFSEEVRADLIKRAALAIQSNNRSAYGAYTEAGKRNTAYISKRRRAFRTTYGFGQSRTPRKTMSRSATRFSWVGAFAPQTVGGRRSHPPKPYKIWEQKINEKENRKAIRSALSASMHSDIVKSRGHRVPAAYPFILSDDFESISKTSELQKSLDKLGFVEEIERASEKKIRAGKGKSRGRKYKNKKGILFVVQNDCSLLKSARNVPGTDVVTVESLNAELLAPGTTAGRLTLFTEGAVKKLTETKMFTNDYKGQIQEKSVEAKQKAATKLEKKDVKYPKNVVKAKKVVKKTAKKDEE